MTLQQRGLVLLIQSALTGEKNTLPDGFDLAEAFDKAKEHGVVPMVYRGAHICGADPQSEAMLSQLESVYRSIFFAEKQSAEFARILAAFDGRKIDYMPLKGLCLRPLYPSPELRRMGDADILIRTEQYPAIREIMLELGYEEGEETDHELCWKKNRIHVELHKRLIPRNNKDYYPYFGDGWGRAFRRMDDSYAFAMKPEDELVYMVAHFAKHYRESGIGIRHLVDMSVFVSAHPGLDMQYVRCELSKIRLDLFYDNVMRTVDVWMRNMPGDSVTDLISEVVLNSGEYGTRHTYMLSSVVRNSDAAVDGGGAKAQSLLKRVFVGREEMWREYPVLQSVPVLLPALWVVYFFKRLFQKDRAVNCVKRHTQITGAEVTEYQRALRFVGLDFHDPD